jgi:sigma-B regulation protein RsbU (phosphoserine phosphatase)
MQQAMTHMQCMEVWGGSRPMAQGVEFGGLDAWVFSKPFGDAQHGGDVYYASSCGTGRITRVLVADVAGHGDDAAAMAAELRTLMRRFVNRLDQSEFVALLNQQFSEASGSGRSATAIVTTFFSPTRRLIVSNAGHPRPLLYRAAERKWSLLSQKRGPGSTPRNTPLGMVAMAEYEQFDLELEPGDYLLCYTDGLTESNDADGSMLGEAGLLRIMRLLGAPDGLQRIAEKLLGEIGDRYAKNLTHDDVTVLVLRANGRAPRYSHWEQLRAFGRFLRSLLRWPVPGNERPPLPDWNIANIGGAIIPALGRRWRARRNQPDSR